MADWLGLLNFFSRVGAGGASRPKLAYKFMRECMTGTFSNTLQKKYDFEGFCKMMAAMLILQRQVVRQLLYQH